MRTHLLSTIPVSALHTPFAGGQLYAVQKSPSAHAVCPGKSSPQTATSSGVCWCWVSVGCGSAIGSWQVVFTVGGVILRYWGSYCSLCSLLCKHSHLQTTVMQMYYLCLYFICEPWCKTYYYWVYPTIRQSNKQQVLRVIFGWWWCSVLAFSDPDLQQAPVLSFAEWLAYCATISLIAASWIGYGESRFGLLPGRSGQGRLRQLQRASVLVVPPVLVNAVSFAATQTVVSVLHPDFCKWWRLLHILWAPYRSRWEGLASSIVLISA